MSKLEIKYLPPDKIVKYINNSRTHSKEQIDQLKASIKEFGMCTPIGLHNGVILYGHARYDALCQLGFTEIPTVDLSHLTETQKRAYVIADNKLALNAGWDEEALQNEMKALSEASFDLSLTGFDADELSALLGDMGTDGLTDEDNVPEIPETPTTVLGDVWLLGNHRLMCGDSTSIDAVEKLMDGQKADMVFTDPPYGMSYGGGRARGDHALNKKGGVLIKAHGMIIGDDKQGDNLIALVRDAVSSAVSVSKSGASSYVCFPWRTYTEFEAAMLECGLKPSACIVWDKKSIGLGNANYRPQHEFIFYVKGGAWYGDKHRDCGFTKACFTTMKHETV